MGNSGNARTTPPHLHFGIYRRGEGAVNPAPFLRQPTGTLADLDWIDALQKANTDAVGFLFRAALEGHVRKGRVFVAEAATGLESARLLVYRRLVSFDVAGARVRIFAGFSLEAGNVYFDDDSISWGTVRKGGSIFIGGDTFIGPVIVAYGRTEGNRDRFYLAIGDTF